MSQESGAGSTTLYHQKRYRQSKRIPWARVSLPTAAQAQDSDGAEYAKTKKGGLLLDKMERKQSRPDAKGSFENAVARNGHALVFQHDSNRCLVKMEPGAKAFTPAGVRWCVSQEAKAAYKNTRKGIFVNGMLQCLDAAGKVVWTSHKKADPFAKLIMASTGMGHCQHETRADPESALRPHGKRSPT